MFPRKLLKNEKRRRSKFPNAWDSEAIGAWKIYKKKEEKLFYFIFVLSLPLSLLVFLFSMFSGKAEGCILYAFLFQYFFFIS